MILPRTVGSLLFQALRAPRALRARRPPRPEGLFESFCSRGETRSSGNGMSFSLAFFLSLCVSLCLFSPSLSHPISVPSLFGVHGCSQRARRRHAFRCDGPGAQMFGQGEIQNKASADLCNLFPALEHLGDAAQAGKAVEKLFTTLGHRTFLDSRDGMQKMGFLRTPRCAPFFPNEVSIVWKTSVFVHLSCHPTCAIPFSDS